MTDTRRQSAGKQIAWLAGMIDADGSIGLHRQNYKGKFHYVPSVSLTTGCLKTTEHLKPIFDEVVAVGSYITKRNPAHKTWNTVWVFEVRGMKRVGTLIPAILPSLVTKENEARIVMEFIHYRQSVKKSTPYGVFEERCRRRLRDIKDNRAAISSPEAICRAPNVLG